MMMMVMMSILMAAMMLAQVVEQVVSKEEECERTIMERSRRGPYERHIMFTRLKIQKGKS